MAESSAPETPPAIEVEGLTRSFPGNAEAPALRDISLSIDQGDYVCIVGRSGSGKSTLLNQLGLLDRPSEGRVLLGGVDTGSLDEAGRTALRGSEVGFVFQDFHLLEQRTVLENVLIGTLYIGVDYESRVQRAHAMIDRVGLSHRVTARANTLSGGERQRTAIARALAARPRLLLCDEPTGNLDSRNSATVLELLAELGADGVTVVMITHDESIAQSAARTITLMDGTVVSDVRKPFTSADAIHKSERIGSPSRRSKSSASLVDLLVEAIAALSQRLSRTLFTMLGTVLGIGALVAILGLNATASGQIRSDFSLTRATEVTVNDAGASGIKDTVFSFPPDPEAVVKTIDGVREAGITWQLPTSGPIPIATSLDPRSSSARMLAYAASPGYLRSLDPLMKSGRLFSTFHDERALPVAVLGVGAARDLNISTTRHRPTIFMQGVAYTVIGIVEDVKSDPSTLAGIFIPSKTALVHYGEPLVETPAQMKVLTRSGAAEVVADQLALALRPDRPDLLQAVPPVKPFETEKRVSESLQSLFLILAGVVLLIGSASIASTNLVAVIERTPEIGLRRALGALPRDIYRQILLEAAVLGLVGGMVGAALSVLIVVITAAAMSWTAILDPLVTLCAPLLGAIVGILAGWYPAYRASAIEPVAALRR